MPKINGQRYSALGAEYDSFFAAVANQQPLTSSSANKIFSRSKVIIGINDQFNPLRKNPIVIYSKLREFEATMAGACYLTQATPDQEQLFAVDREIMTYTSVTELIDKASFLLSNERFRRQMRKSARARSLRDHTWKKRFDRIFRELGII
jgi:spore maturation protein CgeB